jgi:hypothetical protein
MRVLSDPEKQTKLKALAENEGFNSIDQLIEAATKRAAKLDRPGDRSQKAA